MIKLDLPSFLKRLCLFLVTLKIKKAWLLQQFVGKFNLLLEKIKVKLTSDLD